MEKLNHCNKFIMCSNNSEKQPFQGYSDGLGGPLLSLKSSYAKQQLNLYKRL